MTNFDRLDAIIDTVAATYRIGALVILSKNRTQRVAFCRQVAMYLCRKLTGNSFPVIGQHFGRDHSTVFHAYNLIARRMIDEPAFRISIEKIMAPTPSPPCVAAITHGAELFGDKSWQTSI